jgi:hypothetical protein
MDAYAPNLSDAQRPLSGAMCRSLIVSGIFVDVTSYDSAGSMTVFPHTVGSEGAVLLVTAFEGMVGAAVSDAVTSASTPSPTAVSSGQAMAYAPYVECVVVAFLLLQVVIN